MIKFKINKDSMNIEIDESLFHIKDIKAIYDYDSSKNKVWAKTVYLYIWYGYDLNPNNPMVDVDIKERDTRAIEESFGKKGAKFSVKEQEIVNKAINAYVYYSSTSEERALNQFNKMIDEQLEFIDSLEQFKVTKDANGEELREINEEYGKQLQITLMNIDKISKQKKMMKDKILNGESGKVRGDKDSSMIEKGIFKNIVSKTGK